MKKLFIFFILFPCIAGGQSASKGIRFEQGSWKQVKEKAREGKKFIFVDAYTTWCGPCRYMSASIFPRPEVGAFFNEKFLNLKVQLDTTKQDNETVKSWYSDAHQLMADYKIYSFPTYLFFDPEGNLVHRVVGSMDAGSFLQKAAEALRPETQYYTLLAQFRNGKSEPAMLQNLVQAANAAGDAAVAAKTFEAFLAIQPDPFTKESAVLMDQITQKVTDKSFQLILGHPERYDSALGRPGAAKEKLINIILQHEALPALMIAYKPDFAKLDSFLAAKYPAYATELAAKAKAVFYLFKGEWTSFLPAVADYMGKYGQSANEHELNEFAWTVFERSTDRQLLEQALEWSRHSMKAGEQPMFIDTYANLLYKLGRREEAIRWQEKAIALSVEGDSEGYSETLRKMKANEPTWKDK